MPNNRPESLEPRVASLETAMRNLSQGVSDLGVAIGALRSELTSRGRVNWSAAAGLVSVGIVLISAIGTAFLAPMRVEMEFAKILFNEERAKRQAATNDIVQLHERGREVETQFSWSRAANSFAFAEHERFLRMLWRREYGEELPALNVNAIGPNGRY